MSRGRDTATIRLDKYAIADICEGCSDPEAMREILVEYPRALALGRITLPEIIELWNSKGCILWQPVREKTRHVFVKIADQPHRTMIHVCRVVWSATKAVHPSQGIDYYEQLRGDEEVGHFCENIGAKNTAFGTCLNPAHLRRSDGETRVKLRIAYKIIKAAGLQPPPGGMP